MMNYISNMNADLTMACIGFGIFAVSSCVVMAFKAWQTLTIGEWCLAGEGEPDSEELSFRIFCYEMVQAPVLNLIGRVRSGVRNSIRNLRKVLCLVRTFREVFKLAGKGKKLCSRDSHKESVICSEWQIQTEGAAAA